MDVIPLRPTAMVGLSPAANASQDQLAEGRIFAAQVLQLLDGGSVILGVGRERIAATSQATLRLGQRLFLKVRSAGASPVFEFVEQALGDEGLAASLESLESSHPFRWLAQGKGVGELLADLGRALTAGGERAPEAAKELARALQSFALAPGEPGAEVARQLSNSGLAHEARLLARAIESLPQAAISSAAEELVAIAFAGEEVAGGIEPARRSLAAELARLLSDSGEVAQLRRTEFEGSHRVSLAARALAAWIEPALERSGVRTVDAGALARIAEALMFARLSPRLARAVLEVLLGERAMLASVLEEPAALQSNFDAPDLKRWLSTALDKLEPGPERAAVRGAYEALETEQFIALARAGRGDGSSWVFALRDGSGFADARLVHRRIGQREAGEGAEREKPIERAVLGLDFSRTGPVRADLALDGNQLHVRLAVSREDVALRMKAALEELSLGLQAPGRSVQLSVSVRAAEDLRVPGPEADEQLGGGRAAVDQFG